ncbi:GNAT family N-acetyltransferase [Micrococcus sp.]|uniref:GNAT family N-acetyltransferase n=1 Tax=Micrococcus sp. TaxID=1271 RepID=UPI002A916206|nr:GNAT family N-acetyltransferase [Micrococcus sp.]MDY6054722.1 N-acetyltransferase [Micrococcus sp.]
MSGDVTQSALAQDDAGPLPEGVTVRPWRDGDDLALLQVWGDPADVQQHQDRALLGPDADTPWRRCLVAEENGVPVAAGVVAAQPLHPRRLWAYVEVAPAERRRGIGAGLLGRLRALAAEAHAAGTVPTTELRTRFAVASRLEVGADGEPREPDEQAAAAHAAQVAGTEAACVAAGFTPVQRSRRVAVVPGAVALPALRDEDHPDAPVLEEIATGSVELTRAVAEFYDAVHSWDPSTMSVGAAQRLLLAPETGAAGAVALRTAPRAEGGRVRAFAVSYTPERQEAPTDVFLGWDPALPEDEARQAVADLLAMLVAQHPVQLEVDEAMTALEPIVDGLLARHAALTLVDTRIWVTDPQ